MQSPQIVMDPDTRTVIARWGPMQLAIRAERNGRPRAEAARCAAEAAFGYLERIAGFRCQFKRPAMGIDHHPDDPLAATMIENTASIGDPELTPMAAVAGTIADAVADWLAERGMSKVVVDNGGDIAIRFAGNGSVRVGLRPRIGSPEVPLTLTLDSRVLSWGVATSGMGGRSFTRGIASAVMVIAARASMADAAATSIANACYVEDDGIVRQPAEQIDPDTDLIGLDVTVRVGRLSPEQKRWAVVRAVEKAEALEATGRIRGCVVVLDDMATATAGIDNLMSTTEEKTAAELMRLNS